jgi:hypothetical protein
MGDESPGGFDLQPRSAGTGRVPIKVLVLDVLIKIFGSGRVPHVHPSVHGPKTDFSNAFTLRRDGSWFLPQSSCPLTGSVLMDCAPSYSPATLQFLRPAYIKRRLSSSCIAGILTAMKTVTVTAIFTRANGTNYQVSPEQDGMTRNPILNSRAVFALARRRMYIKNIGNY